MGMFDSARIRRTPLTEKLGYADAEGTIFGVTTVSSTGVEVIGDVEDDCAINVDFDGRLPTAWFQPSLVKVTGQPEITMTLGDKTFVRKQGSGEWTEVPRKS